MDDTGQSQDRVKQGDGCRGPSWEPQKVEMRKIQNNILNTGAVKRVKGARTKLKGLTACNRKTTKVHGPAPEPRLPRMESTSTT